MNRDKYEYFCTQYFGAFANVTFPRAWRLVLPTPSFPTTCRPVESFAVQCRAREPATFLAFSRDCEFDECYYATRVVLWYYLTTTTTSLAQYFCEKTAAGIPSQVLLLRKKRTNGMTRKPPRLAATRQGWQMALTLTKDITRVLAIECCECISSSKHCRASPSALPRRAYRNIMCRHLPRPVCKTS